MTASTSSTLRPTTAGTLVAGFPRGRFYASPGTRVLSFSRASSTTLPADALRGPGPLGAREGAGDVAAGRIERSARPLPVAGAGLDQAAQRLVCGAAPRAVLDGHLIARQADRAVDVADGTGPASSRTPYPTAQQAGPQVLRAPVAAALSSPPPDPLPGLAAALRGLTHEAARFPQLIIIYDQIPDRRRGRGFATGIHLNEALEWSKRPGPPQLQSKDNPVAEPEDPMFRSACRCQGNPERTEPAFYAGRMPYSRSASSQTWMYRGTHRNVRASPARPDIQLSSETPWRALHGGHSSVNGTAMDRTPDHRGDALQQRLPQLPATPAPPCKAAHTSAWAVASAGHRCGRPRGS